MIKRIIQIREQNGLSQEKFAEKIGLSRNFINQLENGKKNASDRTILDICREFNINENWLRYGTEPMRSSSEDEISEYVNNLLAKDNPFYDLIKGIMKTYDKLDSKSQEILQHFSEELLKELHTSANEKLNNTNSITTEAATSETNSVREAEEEYIKSRLNSVKNTDSFATSITTDVSKKAINE